MFSELKTARVVVTAIGTAIAAKAGVLAPPVFLLLGLNITDYVTAIMAAPRRGVEINSRRGMAGIKKKISMYILICLGGVADVLLTYETPAAGLIIPARWVFAPLVTMWLICNEVISILENLIDMGAVIPPFLLPLARYIRESIGSGSEGKGKCAGGENSGESRADDGVSDGTER
jgi:toxin secretion/phage lysis holin